MGAEARTRSTRIGTIVWIPEDMCCLPDSEVPLLVRQLGAVHAKDIQPLVLEKDCLKLYNQLSKSVICLHYHLPHSRFHLLKITPDLS